MPIMTGDQKYPVKVTQVLTTRLTGWFTLGAAGAITAQSTTATSTSGGQQFGVTWTKQAGAGDYRPTIHRGYKRLVRFDANLILPAVTTAPLINEATIALPVAAAGNFSGATPVVAAGTGMAIQLVFAGAATPLVANGTNGATVTFDIELADQ